VFRIVALFAVLTGSITSLPIIWAVADVAMGVMTLLNVTAILLLSPWAIAVLADYERSLAAGRQPVFVASNAPGLNSWTESSSTGFNSWTELADGF
jgi:AGCS family alanine or glycine:cation symporter